MLKFDIVTVLLKSKNSVTLWEISGPIPVSVTRSYLMSFFHWKKMSKPTKTRWRDGKGERDGDGDKRQRRKLRWQFWWTHFFEDLKVNITVRRKQLYWWFYSDEAQKELIGSVMSTYATITVLMGKERALLYQYVTPKVRERLGSEVNQFRASVGGDGTHPDLCDMVLFDEYLKKMIKLNNFMWINIWYHIRLLMPLLNNMT